MDSSIPNDRLAKFFDLSTLKRHLKQKYGLNSKFTPIRTEKNNVYPFEGLEITDQTLIADLISSCAKNGQRLQIFNSEGNSIPGDLSISQARNFVFISDDEYIFNSMLKTLDALSISPSYADIDWINRIFVQLIQRTKNEHQNDILKQRALTLSRTSARFLESGYDSIIERIEAKKHDS